MSDSAVTVIIPVLNRPHRVVPVVSSIVHASPGAKVLLIPSAERPDDSGAMHAVISEAMDIGSNVEVHAYRDPHPECGNYAKKINWAINQWVTTPWVFTGADDLYFHPGWWNQVEETWRNHKAARVIGTNDLGHPRVYAFHETSTHSVVNVEYVHMHGLIDQPGKCLYEGYVHEFVDDELVGTAKYRGAWAFSVGALVEHLHPAWDKAPWDETYHDQGRRMNESRALYAQRCPLWGGTPI